MFPNLIGHDRVKKQLQRDVESRQPHHAYLFSGPEHVGKMSLLRELMSQLRDGKAAEGNALLQQQLEAGQGPGLISFLDHGESLKVEQIRTIADAVSKRTAQDQFSFCVIEHLERMTRSAANAFLKMLEEPSERFIFLMTTRREKKLLPTVLSRVQLFRCSVLPEKQVREFVEQQVENAVLAQELMELSMGRIGMAVSMMRDKEVLERMRNLSDRARVLLDHDVTERFRLAEHLTQKDADPQEIFQFLLFLAQKLQREGMERWIPQLDRIQKLNRLFQDTQVNKRMFLEELFLSLDRR
ncbi:MAG: ATP-binding protein [Candidatus Altimarinota bacterium]